MKESVCRHKCKRRERQKRRVKETSERDCVRETSEREETSERDE